MKPRPMRRQRGAARAAVPLRRRLLDDPDECDGFMVLVCDPVTGAADAYGPYTESDARTEAESRLRELNQEDLDEVGVAVVRWHDPR